MKVNQRMRQSKNQLFELAVIAGLAIPACLDFWKIPWGKGIDGTPFSYKWGMAFLFLVIFCITLLVLVSSSIWKPDTYQRMVGWMTKQRSRLGIAGWFLILAAILIPCWLFGYNIYGAVLSSIPLHLMVWIFTSVWVGILLTRQQNSLITWPNMLGGLLITGCGFALANAFTEVTSYPFSMSWSEGNRMWDYSLLFGSNLYSYPAGQKIFAYIDFGRQFLWGLPFLLPHVSITGFRFWNSLMYVLPYALLGWIIMKTNRREIGIWLLAGAWVYSYLNLGAVYPTLIISAILVALAWKRSLWIAIPLLILAGTFTSLSRWTWVFAPAIWIGMLEFSGAELENGRLLGKTWYRTVILGIAGLTGSFIIPYLRTPVLSLFSRLSDRVASSNPAMTLSMPPLSAATPVAVQATATPAPIHLAAAAITATPTATAVPVITQTATPVAVTNSLQNMITDQPLLWYRLFPNVTYPPGILLGLLIAVGPLLILLAYLVATRHWQLSTWQKLGILGPLLAFLGVGLIASVKIGGGSNLHNLDMFTIGLLFVAVIAWHKGIGKELFLKSGAQPAWVKLALVLLIAIPSLQPVTSLLPSSRKLDYERISILLPPDFHYPTRDDVQIALETIRDSVAVTQKDGEILFMDQRQLLTFGFIQDVPLVPDYEKKYMMDLALSGDLDYFADYYQDLADRRFSLIITEPLLINYEFVSLKNFGEENNTWVGWISEPTLCFYKPFVTFEEVGVQLLIPREDTSACSEYLNIGQP